MTDVNWKEVFVAVPLLALLLAVLLIGLFL